MGEPSNNGLATRRTAGLALGLSGQRDARHAQNDGVHQDREAQLFNARDPDRGHGNLHAYSDLGVIVNDFVDRGYEMEELADMPLDDFMELLPARQRRSMLRGFSESQQRFLAHLRKTDGEVRTHRRNMIIIPEMVGRSISVHSGKEFQNITIMPEMLGHILGEFALTRKPVSHTGPGVGATKSSKFMPLK